MQAKIDEDIDLKINLELKNYLIPLVLKRHVVKIMLIINSMILV